VYFGNWGWVETYQLAWPLAAKEILAMQVEVEVEVFETPQSQV
jgi:hypothetical protein